MKKKPAPEEPGCPLWVVTFGDAMSLLVTFFVMLVSFADFEEHALQNMMGALSGGLRAVPMPMASAINRVDHTVKEDDPEHPPELVDGEVAVESGQGVILEQSVENNLQSHMPNYYIQLLDNGVSLIVNHQQVFKTGTATLIDGTDEPWQIAAGLIRAVNNEVRISVILPRNTVVFEEGCSTAWGLGIEQAVVAQHQLLELSGEPAAQVGTCVQVVKRMPRRMTYSYEGCIEIRFVGSVKALMDCMPSHILNGTWTERRLQGGQADG